jgi:ribosome-binding protein aMBF1 (putative translation factor)
MCATFAAIARRRYPLFVYSKIVYTKTRYQQSPAEDPMAKIGLIDAHAQLADLIFALRRERCVTQVELARRLGKPQQFVSLIERGERRIDVVEFFVIVRALDTDPVAAFVRAVDRFPWPIEI